MGPVLELIMHFAVALFGAGAAALTQFFRSGTKYKTSDVTMSGIGGFLAAIILEYAIRDTGFPKYITFALMLVTGFIAYFVRGLMARARETTE